MSPLCAPVPSALGEVAPGISPLLGSDKATATGPLYCNKRFLS